MNSRSALSTVWLIAAWGWCAAAENPLTLESAKLRLCVSPITGSYDLTDRRTGVTWSNNPRQQRLGTVALSQDKGERVVPLDQFRSAVASGRILELTHALPDAKNATLVVRFELLPDGETLQISAASDDPRIKAFYAYTFVEATP